MPARQLLLERGRGSIPATLERMGGLHAQCAPSMYVGLWSRVEGLERGDLTDAVGRRAVVQATLMRATIHLVARDDYRPDAKPPARRGAGSGCAARREPPGRPRWRRRRPACARRSPAPPTRGARSWRCPAGPGGGRRAHRAPLPGGLRARAADRRRRLDGAARERGGAGPRPNAARIARGEDGEELLDLPPPPLPDPETPPPPRFLPSWDAVLLVHARRAGLLPEEYRPRIFGTRMPASLPTLLLDGAVAGTWRHEDGRIALDPFRRLAAAERRTLDAEAERLLAFHAPVSRASAPPRRRRGA